MSTHRQENVLIWMWHPCKWSRWLFFSPFSAAMSSAIPVDPAAPLSGKREAQVIWQLERDGGTALAKRWVCIKDAAPPFSQGWAIVSCGSLGRHCAWTAGPSRRQRRVCAQELIPRIASIILSVIRETLSLRGQTNKNLIDFYFVRRPNTATAFAHTPLSRPRCHFVGHIRNTSRYK